MKAEIGRRFSFFALVDLIERYLRPPVRVGEGGPPSDEVIRFGADPSLAFPISDIALVTEPGGTPQDAWAYYTITTAFLGLVGTVSPIPIFYTEEILRNERAGQVQRAFLDLFHHRLISLFYRCWRKYRFPFEFREECRDSFSMRLLALVGVGAPPAARAVGIQPELLLRCAGLFFRRPRSAAALRVLLRDFLGEETSVTQCTIRRVRLNNSQLTALAHQNASLGKNVMVGSTVTSAATSFRVTVGPLRYEAFVRYLPGRQGFVALVRLIRMFVTDPLDFDIEFLVREATIPPLYIRTRHVTQASRLGQTSWLRRPKARRSPQSDGSVLPTMQRVRPVVFAGRGSGSV